MSWSVVRSDFAVVRGLLGGVGNKKRDGSSGGFSVKDAGEDLYQIALFPWGCDPALPGLPAVQKTLNILLVKGQSCRSAVNDDAKGFPVGLAPCGYLK